jgi:hypothetical protein
MADVVDKKKAEASAADAAAAKSSKKKRDHEVHPDEESEFPWGKVERKKGEVDQVHAFKVFGSKYVFFSPLNLDLFSFQYVSSCARCNPTDAPRALTETPPYIFSYLRFVSFPFCTGS